MILADTSIWVEHLRRGDRAMERLLDDGRVLVHPFVIGELACGNLGQRQVILDLLRALPAVGAASDDEVLFFIEQHALAGAGLGYIDVHLLAAVALHDGAGLWTRDRRLAAAAGRLGFVAS